MNKILTLYALGFVTGAMSFGLYALHCEQKALKEAVASNEDWRARVQKLIDMHPDTFTEAQKQDLSRMDFNV